MFQGVSQRDYRGVHDPHLETLMTLEDRLSDHKYESFADDPAWLRLPFARRQAALNRLKVVIEFETTGQAGVDAVQKAAEALSISPRQFYDLLRAWRTKPSIWSLVPWSARRPARIPKLSADVLVQIDQRIDQAALDGYIQSPRAMVAKVLEDWPANLAAPTEKTVRAHIDKRIRSGVLGSSSLRLNNSAESQEQIENASRVGEVLVIDHTAPDFFVDDSSRHRPVLTLAIDLFSKLPFGFAIGNGKPSALLVREALADAETRTAAVAQLDAMRPRLVLATTSGDEWKALTRDLAEVGITASIRWTPRLHAGGPTSRLIGSSLAGVALMPKKVHAIGRDHDDFDPGKHALMTLEQARLVVADRINELLSVRLEPATTPKVVIGL